MNQEMILTIFFWFKWIHNQLEKMPCEIIVGLNSMQKVVVFFFFLGSRGGLRADR